MKSREHKGGYTSKGILRSNRIYLHAEQSNICTACGKDITLYKFATLAKWLCAVGNAKITGKAFL